MNERLDYLIKDRQCKDALEEFKKLNSVPEWLYQYSDLFCSISIRPKGKPRITNSHFGGEPFENIQLFGSLYSKVNSLFE